MNNKILYVVNVDWFFQSHRLPLAIEAIRKGYEVHLICCTTNKRCELESYGIIVHHLDISRSGTKITHELKAIFNIFRMLRNIKPDIVHFVSIKPVIYGGLITRFLSIPKVVFSISGLGYVFIRKGLKASIFRFLVKLLYRFALGGRRSHAIVQNPDDKQLIKSLSHIPVILIKGSGVDLSKHFYSQEDNGHLVVTMAARLLKDKGVYEFFEAAKLLSQRFPHVKFNLYGTIDVSNPASLSTEELEKINCEGIVSLKGHTDDIPKAFARSNIIALPSYREGFPKVLIEAAASGRAVVTTNVAGCKDAIVQNSTGLLCEPGDVTSLRLALEKLILDSDLRNNMGMAGRRLAIEEFDITSVVSKHFELYES